MSELIQKNNSCATTRWNLLTGASVLVLAAYASSIGIAEADDTDRPQVWIELGGQLSRLSDGVEAFAPDFPNSPPRPSSFSPSQKFDGPPHFSIDEEGKISFQPDESNWVFSASVRYGRSANRRHANQQTNPAAFSKYYYTSNATYDGGLPHRHKHKGVTDPQNEKFADSLVENSEQHFILDFQAGKDVGLGMFGGRDGSSVVSVGVRFAQFGSKSNIAIKSDPDWHFNYRYIRTLLPSFPSSVIKHYFPTTKLVQGQIYHSNAAFLQATRSFHGIGPSLSWSASAPFAGNPQDGQLAVDWGLNAAFLFGRQRARMHHQTTGRYHGAAYAAVSRPITYHPLPVDKTRSRTITVPNVGGFAGLSFRYLSAKISAGYRADLFFGAMDGGIDLRKSENVGFYGPFATISVGIGG